MAWSKSRSDRPRRRLGGPPPRIAFLVDWLEDPYQSAVLSGAVSEAEKRGAAVVALCGGILAGGEKNGAHRNFLYRLAQSPHFDAAVVMTGTLGNELGAEAVSHLVERLGPIPICSIASGLPGHSSVLVDNASGMHSAVEHLVSEHGCQRIAFIRGPEVNPEAEARYKAYRDVLEAHHIPLDPQLVLSGNFQRTGGTAAIRELLDGRGVVPRELDALVAATDQMALGAMDEFAARGLFIPDDVAVVGFDDLEEARYLSPPLATVRQPLADQGVEAVRLLLQQLHGTGEVQQRVLETHFVPRRSCGCLRQESVALSERPSIAGRISLEASLIRQRELVLAELTRAARGNFVGVDRNWESQIFHALLDEFRDETGSSGEKFRKTFDHLLSQVLDANGDVSLGNAVISALRRQLVLCAGDDPNKLRRVESLMHDARVLTSALVERSQARERLRVERWARLLGDVSAQLVTAASPQELATSIEFNLPRLGIDLCVIAELLVSPPDWARVTVGLTPGEPPSSGTGLGSGGGEPSGPPPSTTFTSAPPSEPSSPGSEPEFPAGQLAPEFVLDRDSTRSLVVEPLMQRQRIYGFAVFGYSPVEGYAYEMLQEILSANLLAHSVGTQVS